MPAGAVLLAALKPAGAPLASADADLAPTSAPDEVEVTLRAYECVGRPVAARVTSALGLRRAQLTNLLEEGQGEPLELDQVPEGDASALISLGVGEIVTVRLGFAAGSHGAVPDPRDLEPALPVFSRYWLHNKGPAPMGNQSVAAHVLPTALVARAGGLLEVVAQVASSSARSTQAGRLEIVVPSGWVVEPPGKLYSLAPGAHLREKVRIEVPSDCRPGRYFAAVQTTDPAGQPQEDVLTVDVLPSLATEAWADGDGGSTAPELLEPPAPFAHPAGQVAAELEAELEQSELSLAGGAPGALGLVLANRTAGELRGEVQLLSPLETWPLLEPWSQGFSIGRGGTTRIEVSVRGPAVGWLSSWALFKVTYFGRLWYSPPVALRLGAESAAAVSSSSGHHA